MVLPMGSQDGEPLQRGHVGCSSYFCKLLSASCTKSCDPDLPNSQELRATLSSTKRLHLDHLHESSQPLIDRIAELPSDPEGASEGWGMG